MEQAVYTSPNNSFVVPKNALSRFLIVAVALAALCFSVGVYVGAGGSTMSQGQSTHSEPTQPVYGRYGHFKP